MNNSKRILVFSATYNEIDNIELLIYGIKKNIPESSILIIDDNSPDNTQKVVKRLKQKIPTIELIVRDKKLGLDSAHKMAFNYAIENKFDLFITMDADMSHDPIELPKFLKELENFSFVIGSRYVRGGKCLMKGPRLIMSKVGNYTIKKISGINSSEYTNAYRGFNLKKLKKFSLNNVSVKGYSFFMGTLFEIDKENIEIREIPITFNDRVNGVSKIPKIEIIRTLFNLFLLVIKKKISK